MGIEAVSRVDPVDEFSATLFKVFDGESSMRPSLGIPRRASRAAVEGGRRQGAEATFIGAALEEGIELLCTVDPVDEFSMQRLKEFDSRELKPTFVAEHIDEHPVRWMKESDGRARRPSSRPCPRWALRSRAWWILSMRFERSSGRTSTARSASRPSLRTQSTVSRAVVKRFDGMKPSQPSLRPCS